MLRKALWITGTQIESLELMGEAVAEVDLRSGGLESRRPLSPHLMIYRPMLTMMMSIVHRITGAALYFGTLLLAW